LEYRRGLRDIVVDVSLNVARGEAVALIQSAIRRDIGCSGVHRS